MQTNQYLQRILFLLVIITTFSCTKAKDINRVNETYWDKSYFNKEWQSQSLSNDKWMYHFTVVDTSTNTTAASIGEGQWLHHENIRFEITEKLLIGWRTFATVTGTEAEFKNGAKDNYRGAPVVAFPINSHFDVIRKFDTVTHETSNVIQEDTIRPWYERRFMRVDWTKNLAQNVERGDPFGREIESFGTGQRPTYLVTNSDPTDPKRFRFLDGYFDTTSRQAVTVDYASLTGGYGDAYQGDVAAPIVDTMHSFLKIEENDYEPLHYPDSVVQTDTSGKPMLDEKGFNKILPIWEKFGFFRTNIEGRQSYSPTRGSLESGKNYNIARFNIWKKTRDENGKIIPIEIRETKPIVYYTNVGHPDSLIETSIEVASEWNMAFKQMVFYAQPTKYSSIESVPDMFVLRENSCNIINIENIIANNAKLASQLAAHDLKSISNIKADIKNANNFESGESFTVLQGKESQAKADLERICSAMEYYTQGADNQFIYQRLGDVRFNLFNLITKQAQTRWSGYGPMLADPITGEIKQATANINLWYIDRRAASASEQIDAMNQEIVFRDLVLGEKSANYVDAKLSEGFWSASNLPSDDAMANIEAKLADVIGKENRLENQGPTNEKARFARIAGSSFEKKLFDPKGHDALLVQDSRLRGSGNLLTEDILNEISPARGKDLLEQFNVRKKELEKSALTVMDPPEFLDRLVFGAAIELRDIEKNRRFHMIRKAVFKATLLHEVGHNVGLMHNMASTKDPLNYPSQFWEIEALPKNINQAIKTVADQSVKSKLDRCLARATEFPNLNTQDCLRQQEAMYSSVMDYHAQWNSNLSGLAPCDLAAINFGYAQMVEIFPLANLKVNPDRVDLKKWLFLHDWRKIPSELLGNTAQISQRNHIKYYWGSTQTSFVAPSNEVPYRFCIDPSGTHGPECKAFDFGPDMRSRAQWNNTIYWQHYFATHFAKDRLWTANRDLVPSIMSDISTIDDFANIMHWYYYYKRTMPDFTGSDAEKDYLSAVVSGLNHFAHIFGHPAPGEHVSAPVYMVENNILPTADQDRNEISEMLVPYESFEYCAASNAVVMTKNRKSEVANPGYILSNVALGDGRPFYIGYTNDYDDNYLNYVGSYFTKMYALSYLGSADVLFPRADAEADPRFNAISWYRLFPDQVGQLVSDLILDNQSNLGPVVDKNGKLQHRNLLDPDTFLAPDYSNMSTVKPTLSNSIQYRAMLGAAAQMSDPRITELNFSKMMRVAVMGAEDDLRTMDSMNEQDLAVFEHPDHGMVYRAIKSGKFPIAYTLVQKLNRLSERYARLNACVNSEEASMKDKFCYCVKLSERNACCAPSNPSCPAPGLSKVGEGICAMSHLISRRDRAKEDMNDLVNFLDDMRWLTQRFDSAL